MGSIPSVAPFLSSPRAEAPPCDPPRPPWAWLAKGRARWTAPAMLHPGRRRASGRRQGPHAGDAQSRGLTNRSGGRADGRNELLTVEEMARADPCDPPRGSTGGHPFRASRFDGERRAPRSPTRSRTRVRAAADGGAVRPGQHGGDGFVGRRACWPRRGWSGPPDAVRRAERAQGRCAEGAAARWTARSRR